MSSRRIPAGSGHWSSRGAGQGGASRPRRARAAGPRADRMTVDGGYRPRHHRRGMRARPYRRSSGTRAHGGISGRSRSPRPRRDGFPVRRRSTRSSWTRMGSRSSGTTGSIPTAHSMAERSCFPARPVAPACPNRTKNDASSRRSKQPGRTSQPSKANFPRRGPASAIRWLPGETMAQAPTVGERSEPALRWRFTAPYRRASIPMIPSRRISIPLRSLYIESRRSWPGSANIVPHSRRHETPTRRSRRRN